MKHFHIGEPRHLKQDKRVVKELGKEQCNSHTKKENHRRGKQGRTAIAAIVEVERTAMNNLRSDVVAVIARDTNNLRTSLVEIKGTAMNKLRSNVVADPAA